MGIFCEINLSKPSDGVFVAGGTVSGIIKYAIDEITVFNQITVSLKGMGRLRIRNRHRHRKGNRRIRTNAENYVELHNVIKFDQNPLSIGAYEIQFNFTLPKDIPPSFKYHKMVPLYIIDCKIFYYVRIKFERPGFMKSDKHFKKEILVAACITPKLPIEPVIFGESKTLTQLFSRKKSIVNIKVLMNKCVYTPGEKICFEYEVVNDTNMDINGIEIKLMEVFKFTTSTNFHVKSPDDVPEADSKTGSLKSGKTLNMSAEILIPLDRCCIENSKIVSKYYVVYIIAEIPMPHRNAILKIPVQVGHLELNTATASYSDGPPPDYWEAMGDCKENDDEEFEKTE